MAASIDLLQGTPPEERPARGFWSKMREALGA